jgi:hypothetical protein
MDYLLIAAISAVWFWAGRRSVRRPDPMQPWADGYSAGYFAGCDDNEAVRPHRDGDRSYDLGYQQALKDWEL